MPEEWKEAVISPLQKKGDKQICSNYRGISLLNTVCELFSKILLGRLNNYTESVLYDGKRPKEALMGVPTGKKPLVRLRLRCFESGWRKSPDDRR